MAAGFRHRQGQETDTPTIHPHPDPLNAFIWNAIIERATDVHLHCVEEGLRVLYRVDGAIHPKVLLPPAEGRRLLNQLKGASGLNAVRAFAPLEGQIVWPDERTRWEIRVTLTPVGGRESAHLRLLSLPRDHWRMTDLGLSSVDQERIAGAVHSLNGLILVTGATGSGKTTTMYSLASLLDLKTTTAYSIEDPVEFRLPYAQQIEVDDRHGLTMHEGLRTILRMDPDLILIGEIRDSDSAIVAARAALSGRLVLATIHAQDAAGAVDALHYLGVPQHIIGGSLRLVIAQSLVRRLCAGCARPRGVDAEERALFSRFGIEGGQTILEAGSCPRCSAYGYKGRIGAFETALVDDEVGALISAGTHHRELAGCLRNRGVRSLAHDALEKVATGVTAMEEFRRLFTPTRDTEPVPQATEPIGLEMIAP